jgi:hypothetical protein
MAALKKNEESDQEGEKAKNYSDKVRICSAHCD